MALFQMAARGLACIPAFLTLRDSVETHWEIIRSGAQGAGRKASWMLVRSHGVLCGVAFLLAVMGVQRFRVIDLHGYDFASTFAIFGYIETGASCWIAATVWFNKRDFEGMQR